MPREDQIHRVIPMVFGIGCIQDTATIRRVTEKLPRSAINIIAKLHSGFLLPCPPTPPRLGAARQSDSDEFDFTHAPSGKNDQASGIDCHAAGWARKKSRKTSFRLFAFFSTRQTYGFCVMNLGNPIAAPANRPHVPTTRLDKSSGGVFVQAISVC
jgi:hypothetical protein